MMDVVAVLVAGRDHQQAKADDRVEPVHDALRVAWVREARRQASGHVEALLHLAQHRQATVGRQVAAVEAGDDGLAADW